MKTKEYHFDGSTYVCRIVQANDGEELVIAPTALLEVIQPGSIEDENEGFANKEAEYIYDEIFFFTDAETLALPEEQFIEELKKDNRGWFECKHSVNHVFSSPTSIINFTSKKPSYDDTRRSGRDNELLQRAQNDL